MVKNKIQQNQTQKIRISFFKKQIAGFLLYACKVDTFQVALFYCSAVLPARSPKALLQKTAHANTSRGGRLVMEGIRVKPHQRILWPPAAGFRGPFPQQCWKMNREH